MNIEPLKRSRDLRLLVCGQLVSVAGSQMTMVAVPVQVYVLTNSSVDVGLVSIATLVPLLIGAIGGGILVDVIDRRSILVVTSLASAAVSAGMAYNSVVGPALWPLFAGPSVTALLGALDDAASGAMLPNVVDRSDLTAANAILQSLFQCGLVLGPAVAGLLLTVGGSSVVFWIDAVSYLVAALTSSKLNRQRPVGGADSAEKRSAREVVAFLRRSPRVTGAFAIDVNATVFGIPRALFPALGATIFGGGPATVGLLYAAPGLGALCGALTSGWTSRVRRDGRTVVAAVLIWGTAIALFGLTPWLLPALLLLVVAGWADVISAILRSTIVGADTPDAMRGRVAGLHTAVVTGAPRIGDGLCSAAAVVLGPAQAATTAGVLCIVGTITVAKAIPGFQKPAVTRG